LQALQHLRLHPDKILSSLRQQPSLGPLLLSLNLGTPALPLPLNFTIQARGAPGENYDVTLQLLTLDLHVVSSRTLPIRGDVVENSHDVTPAWQSPHVLLSVR